MYKKPKKIYTSLSAGVSYPASIVVIQPSLKVIRASDIVAVNAFGVNDVGMIHAKKKP